MPCVRSTVQKLSLWYVTAASCADVEGVFVPMTMQSVQEQVRARLLSSTQAAVDRVGRRFSRGRGYRELIRASLVDALADAGLMFPDDVLDHMTDTIAAGQRVDANTVIPWRRDPTHEASAGIHPYAGTEP